MKKILLLSIWSFTIVKTNAQCWQYVSTTTNYSLAIKTDSTLWAWGKNVYGTLGDGTTVDKIRPIQVDPNHSWSIVSSGTLFSLAIKTDGTLWSWGENSWGELGDGNNPNPSYIPKQIGISSDWQSIATGRAHALALKTDGTLWAWGYNDQGQVGTGNSGSVTIPTQIGTDNDWIYIATGDIHSLAIKTDGTLWGWGYNFYGELGDGTNSWKDVPTQIGTSNNWQSLSAGSGESRGIKTDGTLWSWGNRNVPFNQGNGTLIPTQIGVDTDWKSVSFGGIYTLALKSDSTLWSWGNNTYGNLGDGTNADSPVPVQIGIDKDWKIIATGEAAEAIKFDSTLWAWGRNNYAQLGDCGNINQNAPEKINCISNCGALPVTLISFNAKNNGDVAFLTWQTALEKNNREYQIERSADNTRFDKIGVVVSKNNPNGSFYSFTDVSPYNGHNYYRLKSVDIDEKYVYSNIIEVTFDIKKNEVTVYPNPVKNLITINNKLNGLNLYIQLSDQTGRVLWKIVRPNKRQIEIPVWNLLQGFYFIRISDGTAIVSKKIIKE